MVFKDRITTTEARCVLNNLPTNCIISQFPAFFSRILPIFVLPKENPYKKDNEKRKRQIRKRYGGLALLLP